MSKSRGNRTRFQTQEAHYIDPDRTWFVMRCKPSRDGKAAQALEEAGVNVYLPSYKVTVVRRGRKIDVERRFFASYLFAGIGRDRNGDLDYAPLYDREFTFGPLGEDGPAIFPAGALQLIADRLAGQDRDETERGKRREAAARLEIGKFYQATNGPFASFMAEVTAVLDCGTIRADVDIFGRKTPVEFEPDWLKVA